MKKRNLKKGFTIVELVIVIAVIAILSAVLIPTFGSVVENANKSAALQEARNAYTEYLADKAGSGEVLDNLYVYANGYMVEIEDGAVKDDSLVKTADKAGYTSLNIVKTPAVVACNGCSHEEDDPAHITAEEAKEAVNYEFYSKNAE